MTGAIDLHAIAQIFTIKIVDCLVEGSLIALFAGFALRLSPRKSSAMRFALWFSALMAIAALPLLSSVRWSRGLSVPGQSTVRPEVTLPGSWAHYMFGAWAGVTTWCVLRVVLGLWHMHALRKNCVPIESAVLDPRLRATLENGRGTSPVRLCVSDVAQVPMAVGLVAPVVIVPRWVIEELSPDELNQILLHEVAHLRRWDDWTNFAQKLVKALVFFHPAVWWIERKISLEREMACDDAVIAETARPRAYAECLTHLAEKTFIRRSLALAQAAVGRVRQTSRRVAQILDPNRPRASTRVWKSAVPLVAGFAITCALLVSRGPQLIAFRDTQLNAGPTIAASSKLGIPPTPAALKTADVPASRTTSREHAARVALAKNKVSAKPAGSGFDGFETAFIVEHSTVEPNMVQTTGCDSTSLISTETVYLLLEKPAPGASRQPLYEIHVWRLTVFHPATRSLSKEPPHKET